MKKDSATISEIIAPHYCGMTYEKLPKATIESVKYLLLDYLGVAVSGSQTESGRVAREFAASTGGHPQATLIGDGRRVPAMSAAFANAISSHSG